MEAKVSVSKLGYMAIDTTTVDGHSTFLAIIPLVC